MGGSASVELSAQRIADIFRTARDDHFFKLTTDPTNFVFTLLRDTSPSHDMTVDGSGTSVSFRYTVPAGRSFEFWRLTFHIIDGSVRADGFGGLAPLSNGVLVRILNADESVQLDLSDNDPFVRHADFSHLAGIDVTPDQSGVGGAQDNVSVRWTVSRSGRAMLLASGQIIEFVIQDDLTGLTEFHAMVQGILR